MILNNCRTYLQFEEQQRLLFLKKGYGGQEEASGVSGVRGNKRRVGSFQPCA